MIAIVILAAGSSSRMGRPKQNLLFGEKTLLQHAINEAKLVTDMVLVTIGAGKKEILPTIKDLHIEILENDKWNEGMASSITLAANYLLSSANEISAVIFMLCDQPYANEVLLKKLVYAGETSGKGIIASSYGGIIGVPAYFKKKYFTDLSKLKGKEGAKKLIEQFHEDLQIIPFPLGEIDIDTPKDFERLLFKK